MSLPKPPIAQTVRDLRRRVASWREAGARVALVPTMGALHEGHLSLVRLARMKGYEVVVSIFVNPTQFSPSEDFAAYPRNVAADARLLAREGCGLVYAPRSETMYPPGFATSVKVEGVSAALEGASRPHHFGGVATVVTKLLIQCGPDAAVFGEKDYQQLLVIRRLVTDLDLPVEIIGAPTVREPDGLALSSRNAYLSAAERPIAGRMNPILKDAAAALGRGEAVEAVESLALAALKQAGFAAVDYVEVRAADNLGREGPGPIAGPARVLAAVRVGNKTRLIDNCPVTASTDP